MKPLFNISPDVAIFLSNMSDKILILVQHYDLQKDRYLNALHGRSFIFYSQQFLYDKILESMLDTEMKYSVIIFIQIYYLVPCLRTTVIVVVDYL